MLEISEAALDAVCACEQDFYRHVSLKRNKLKK